MKRILFLIIPLIIISCTRQADPVKIIFDTDFGGDADDLGALAMLNHFHERGECELLAVMNWSTEESVVPGIHAVNTYYGHPEIPIGTRKDGTWADTNNYARPIAEAFSHELSYEKAQEVTALYRKILSQAYNGSIVIVAVGPLKNIEYLLKSGPDDYSPLDGRTLVLQKVKHFVVMGGQFPEGENEWNFNGNMPGVTKYVLENLPVPVVFSGFEIGVAIKSGEVFNDIDPNSPLYVGFMHFSSHASWMKDNFRGKILDNSTFDQTAVLYAVRGGEGHYWNLVENGYCVADSTGGNTWVEGVGINPFTGEAYDHAYLELIMDPEEIAAEIEGMMLGAFE